LLQKLIEKIYPTKGALVINQTYYQQGDVLLKERKSIPKGFKEVKTDLIHKGENHHHRMRGDFKVFTKDQEMYVDVKKPSEIFHEEHKTFTVVPGIYEKGIVLEYDHWLEESRQVID